MTELQWFCGQPQNKYTYTYYCSPRCSRMIALVTDILSRYGINIAQMTVTRENAGEKAIMIIEIDSHQCDEAVNEIARIPHLHNVTFSAKRGFHVLQY